jgi:hypothetical protein
MRDQAQAPAIGEPPAMRRLSSGQPIVKAERRTRSITVRLTASEYAKLLSQAAGAQVELSTLARAVLLDAAIPRRARKVATADQQQLARLLAALGKLGSNLNQMARQANTTGELASVASLRQIGQELAQIRLLLVEALG